MSFNDILSRKIYTYDKLGDIPCYKNISDITASTLDDLKNNENLIRYDKIDICHEIIRVIIKDPKYNTYNGVYFQLNDHLLFIYKLATNPGAQILHIILEEPKVLQNIAEKFVQITKKIDDFCTENPLIVAGVCTALFFYISG